MSLFQTAVSGPETSKSLADQEIWNELVKRLGVKYSPLVEGPPRKRSAAGPRIRFDLQVIDEDYNKKQQEFPHFMNGSSAIEHVTRRVLAILRPFMESTTFGCQLNTEKKRDGGYQFINYSLTMPAAIAITKANSQGKARDYFIIQHNYRFPLVRDQSHFYRLLSYMALVHQELKEAGEEDTEVYGMATNSYQFTFVRIDNQSQFYIFAPETIYPEIGPWSFQTTLGEREYRLEGGTLSRWSEPSPWDAVVTYIDNVFNPTDKWQRGVVAETSTERMCADGFDMWTFSRLFEFTPLQGGHWSIPREEISQPLPWHIATEIGSFNAPSPFFPEIQDAVLSTPRGELRDRIEMFIQTALVENMEKEGGASLPVDLQRDKDISSVLTYHGQTVMVGGRADLVLGYGDIEDASRIRAALIIRPKPWVDIGHDAAVEMLGQLVTIQNAREMAGNEACAVFGIITDGVSFWFMQLDASRKWSRSDQFENWFEQGAIMAYASRIVGEVIHTGP